MTDQTEQKPEAAKATAVAPHAMWMYGPKDEPILLAEGDEIPDGYRDHPKKPPPEQH